VKSGGRVVKNVTGYDLHRLWCGSQGTLCFLLEATLRLHPAPAEVATLERRCAAPAEALALAHALWRAGIQPVAVLLRAAAGGTVLDVVLAGRAEALASELAAATAAVADAEILRGEAAHERRAELRELELRSGTWAPLFITCPPSRLGEALAGLARASAELGLAPWILCHPLLASVTVDFPGVVLDEHVSAALERAFAKLQLVLHWRGAARRNQPARLLPAAAALMQRLKQSLDPAGVFVRGRFHDGL
jgi:glycolate oxidase FAD binding subunit